MSDSTSRSNGDPQAPDSTVMKQDAAVKEKTLLQKWIPRVKPIVFVLLTLALWFVFALLAQAIVTTVPRVDECLRQGGIRWCMTSAWSHTPTSDGLEASSAESRATEATQVQTSSTPASAGKDVSGGKNSETAPGKFIDWVVLIIALLGALWAASRAVFPPEDFDTPSEPLRPGPPAAPSQS